MLIASTTEVVITAVVGFVGTIIGALISRAVAVSQRRSDKDDEVREAGVKFATAVEELRVEESMECARTARARLVELAFAAMGAGIDTRLVHGAIKYGGDWLLTYPDAEQRKEMRADPLTEATDSAAPLIAAVDTIPYRRRRGPFMDRELKAQAEEYGALDEAFYGIRERPETGLMWRLARFSDRLHRRTKT